MTAALAGSEASPIHQFLKRRLGVAHHIRSNTFQEPGVAEFSSRDCGFPGILVGIGQRTQNHLGQRIHIREQCLLSVTNPTNLLRVRFERRADTLFGLIKCCVNAAQLFFESGPHERAWARIVAGPGRLHYRCFLL